VGRCRGRGARRARGRVLHGERRRPVGPVVNLADLLMLLVIVLIVVIILAVTGVIPT
jgi:hypothetical protein